MGWEIEFLVDIKFLVLLFFVCVDIMYFVFEMKCLVLNDGLGVLVFWFVVKRKVLKFENLF